MLAKYRFGGSKVTPFVEAGPEYRTAGNLNDTKPSRAGVTAGVGVEGHWLGFQIAPVVRYTRWARDNSVNNISPAQSKPDQLEILLSISHRTRAIGHPFGGHLAIGAVAGLTLTHDESNSSMPVLLIIQPFTPTPEAATEYDSGADAFLLGPALELTIKPAPVY